MDEKPGSGQYKKLDHPLNLDDQTLVYDKTASQGTTRLSLKRAITLIGILILLTIEVLGIRYAVNISKIQLTAPNDATPLRSYLPKDVLGKAYLATLEENLAGNWSKQYGSSEQLAGTNLAMVNWTANKFEQFGFDATVDEYLSYVAYPEEQSLALLQPAKEEGEKATVVHNASFIEDSYEQDPYSQHSRPAFLGYSPSGDVTAEYVFCNYGTYEDFRLLEHLNVSLAGKIAVMRYGKNFRGLKVKFAQDHNMSAALLFNDPVDDGNITVANGVKAYPEGPARNPSSIQRGSVQFLSSLPGDPTTPGYAIKPGENKSRSDPHYSIPRIPALPISERDATVILKKISGHGPQIPDWNRGLIKGYDYSVGPNSGFQLSVHNRQNATIATLHNVLAKIEGQKKNDVILIGNHRDSWTPSAGDPHSGSSVILEIARGLGELAKMGWKPQRTIVFASWDGEEYGLLGSTDFGTYYAKKLQANVVAYVNLDAAVSGKNLKLAASPLLYDVLLSVASQLPYSESQTLLEHFEKVSSGTGIQNLGSGSDYTVFLEHLGIPAVDINFQSGKNSPVYHYHSIYDSYTWMTKYGDPGFKFHNLLAKYAGLLVLELSETKVIQLKTADYALKLAQFSDTVFSKVPEKWLYSQAFSSHCPHHKNITVKQVIDNTRTNLAKLLEKNEAIDAAAEKQQYEYDHWDDLSFWERVKLVVAIARTNHLLKYYERSFLTKDGLRNRPWFKHIVFVSGRYTGYGGQQLPGMTEALEDGRRRDFIKDLTHFDILVSTLAH